MHTKDLTGNKIMHYSHPLKENIHIDLQFLVILKIVYCLLFEGQWHVDLISLPFNGESRKVN